MSTKPDFNFIARAEGVTYTPWTDGWAIGYRVDYAAGGHEFIYLNPSGSDSEEQPCVFVYQGERGDPGSDTPLHHYTLTP
jgi:hypothetical protein